MVVILYRAVTFILILGLFPQVASSACDWFKEGYKDAVVVGTNSELLISLNGVGLERQNPKGLDFVLKSVSLFEKHSTKSTSQIYFRVDISKPTYRGIIFNQTPFSLSIGDKSLLMAEKVDGPYVKFDGRSEAELTHLDKNFFVGKIESELFAGLIRDTSGVTIWFNQNGKIRLNVNVNGKRIKRLYLRGKALQQNLKQKGCEEDSTIYGKITSRCEMNFFGDCASQFIRMPEN